MDLRKPLFLEHLLSSKRRVVSGFGVGAAASLLVIFLLLFLSAPPAASSSSSSSSSLFSWFFSVPEQQKAVGSPSPEEGLQTARGDGNSSRTTVEEEAGGPSNHSVSAQDLSGKIQFQEDKPTPSVAIKDGGSGTAPPEENTRKGNLSSSPRPSNGTHPSGGGGIPEKTQYATRKNASRDGDNGKIFELKDGVGERNRLDPGGGGGSRSSGEGRASERVEEEEEAAAAASAGKNNSSNNSRSRSNNKNNNNNGSAPSKAPGLGGLSGKCDIFDGRWVRDEHEPFYPAGSCPFIDGDFDCHKNGRPDDGFLKWRWQPYRCDIPR